VAMCLFAELCWTLVIHTNAAIVDCTVCVVRAAVQHWCVTAVTVSPTRHRDVPAYSTLTCFTTSLPCASHCRLSTPTTILRRLTNSCLLPPAASTTSTRCTSSSRLTLSSCCLLLVSTSDQKVISSLLVFIED